MLTKDFIESVIILLVILNPFLMSVYLIEFIQELDFSQFASTIIRAVIISSTIFILFAWWGDGIFSSAFGIRYAAFLLFGGIIFLIIGIRFVFEGSGAIKMMRGGEAKHLTGSVALPFLIGPGSVNASILAGSKLQFPYFIFSILTSMFIMFSSLVIFKLLFDFVKKRNAIIVERYLDIVGRLSSLLIGTIAIDMCMRGFEMWYKSIK